MDRNIYYADKDCDWVRSLSARRAWIEIERPTRGTLDQYVALRKESVDRNSTGLVSFRACITVALRKESVDRNLYGVMPVSALPGRSPQGERG